MRAHLFAALFLSLGLGGCAAGIQSPLTAGNTEPVEDWSVLGEAAAPVEAPEEAEEGAAAAPTAQASKSAQTAQTAGDYEVSFTEAPPPPPRAAPRPRHGFAAPPISKKKAQVVSSGKN